MNRIILYLILALNSVGCRNYSKLPLTNVHIEDFGGYGNDLVDDTHAFLLAASRLNSGGTLYLKKNQVYILSPLLISTDIKLIGNGAVLKANPDIKDKNVGFNFDRNAVINNVKFDGVWLAFKTINVTKGIIKNCTFYNQTYSNISIINESSNIIISYCTFKGKAKGLDGKASYPCLQITTGSKNITFKNNKCIDVVAGVTADGMNQLLQNIVLKNNYFDRLTYYALKTDVGNIFIFENNIVKNALYGVFYEALDESENYTSLGGNGLVVEQNTFINVERCLYVAGKNPYTEVVFNHNVMNSCRFGVNRSCGTLKILNNQFINGESLYHYFDALGEGNIFIIKNDIINTIRCKEIYKDWDGEDIQGSIVLSCVRMFGLGSYYIERNFFKNWEGKAIHIARIANSYADIKVINNKFVKGDDSKNILTIGAAQIVKVENNILIGIIANPVIMTNESHVSYKPNSGSKSIYSLKKNSWQEIHN
ncbi:MAG: right-handed parallel beta-helix repeat-containing protein [Saprospiraceae bacterium]|nr:right-handed parallel beta-helix repeat-containing protein [Saprospiraceae bacterium]